MTDKPLIVKTIPINELVPVPYCISCGCKEVSIASNHVVCPTHGRQDYFATLFEDQGISDNRDKQRQLLEELTKEAKIREQQAKFKQSALEFQEQEDIIISKDFQDCIDRIQSLKKYELYIIKAPTGTGKTYNLVQAAIKLVQQEKKVCLVFSTKNEVQRAYSMLISAGFADDEITLVVKDIMNEEQIANGKIELKNIIITTYSYLNTRGDSQETFSIARKILQGRTAILDECHVIKEMSQVNTPIAARYYTDNGNNLRRAERCPQNMKKAKCSHCGILNKHYINNYQKVEYYGQLPLKEYEKEFKNGCMLGDLANPDFYTDGSMLNVKTKRLTSPQALRKILSKEMKFFSENIDHLTEIELRCQFPYIEDEDENKQYITPKEIKDEET